GELAVLVVPLLARDLARAAADAVRDVDQRRLDRHPDGLVGRGGHVRFPRNQDLAATGALNLTTLTRHAFVSCVPAPGSPASIVRCLTLTPVDMPLKPQL